MFKLLKIGHIEKKRQALKPFFQNDNIVDVISKLQRRVPNNKSYTNDNAAGFFASSSTSIVTSEFIKASTRFIQRLIEWLMKNKIVT